MFDWKILAASFAALLIVSSVLIGGLGFTDIVDNVRDWLGGSPFGGFVDFPEAGSKEAAVIIYKTPFSFSPEDPINVTIGEAEMSGFSGSISADFEKLSLKFSADGLMLTVPISNITIDGISIGKLALNPSDFSVKSDNLETAAENGTLEMTNFVGSIEFRDTRATFTGNFTTVKGNGKQIV